MWKDYSADYIKNNRASGTSIRIAAFTAALLLAFLCSLFYNFWLDNIEGTKQEEGGWHGRISGEITEEDLETINFYANVETAVVNDGLSGEQETVVDIYFYDKRTVYQDMNALINILGLSEKAADYNYQLLSLYFIRIPGDEMPRMLMPAYLAIVGIVCLSLILIIHNSFALSMNSRIHQFGILASVGATPGQIRTGLVQEALVLTAAPILFGILTGFAFSFVTVRAMIVFAANLTGGREMAFGMHPAILAVIFLLAVFTVLISAWIPAGKLSKLTPLEAIRGTGELQLKKRKGLPSSKHSRILFCLFGMEGELAGNALKAQKKALRTTSISLTFAFLGFMLMQCFFTLSGISTNHTYFERYQNVWDVMVTVKDTGIEDFTLFQEVRALPGADSSVMYQKADALCILPKEAQSRELLELGGLESFAEDTAASREDSLCVRAPILILDDGSFQEFCRQIGIAPGLDGTIVLNRFWDSINSNFRSPLYIPYIKEDTKTITLQNIAGRGESDPASMIEIPVLACTGEPPILREEYDDYVLVQFIPLSLWEKISGQIGGAARETFLRILADNRTDPEAMNMLENEIVRIVSQEYEAESENRIREKFNNDKMIKGYELVLGAFCVLLAFIGIVHVFSHTLGFLHQRKREFARYMSVGVTPEGIRKLFCIEALIITGRPMLVTLLLTTVAVAFMIKASYIDPMEFISVAPVLPILAFVLTVMCFIGLAYYLGGRKILKVSLADALRDDTMM